MIMNTLDFGVQSIKNCNTFKQRLKCSNVSFKYFETVLDKYF